MRILLITNRFKPENTTVGNLVHTVAKRFQVLGHEVFIVTTTRDRGEAGRDVFDGLNVLRIYSDFPERFRAYLSLYNPQTVGKVKTIIHEFNPDVIHFHNIHYYISYYCLKLAKKSGAKVFLTSHDLMLFHYGKFIEYINPNDLSCPKEFSYKLTAWQIIKRFKRWYNPFRNIVIRHYIKYADKIFAVSGELKKACEQNGIRNMEVLHNGLGVDDWQVGSEAVGKFKEKYNLTDRKVIFYGARLSPEKGGEKAVYILNEVSKKIPNVSLLILGARRAYTDRIQQIADGLGIGERIIFTGWLDGDDLLAAYHVSDVVIVPSISFDSFPTVNLEAMLCGKPVVATCFGGSREAILDGETGFITNPYNIEFFAGRVIELLQNPELAKKFGEAGIRRAQENFRLKNHINNLLKWYS